MSTPNPNAVLTPEQIVEQLRALQAQIGNINPLTPEQRRTVRRQTRSPQPVVEASINVIGASDVVTGVIGISAADVRQMVDEASRWAAVEGELRAALNGVAGANLVRRLRIDQVTGQAYLIGKQMSRVSGQSALVPHVQEVKRLRKIASRKKHADHPAEPAPSPAPSPTEETPKE